MNISDVRSYFPYLKNGMIYFNHASTGPVTTIVRDRINDLLVERSENNPDDYASFLKIAEETKLLLSEYLNTTSDRIAFTDNTSNGINILANGITWIKGDHIILNDQEFPANVYPFMNLQTKGVKIDFVKSNDGIVTAEDIIEKVTEKTRLISVSFVQFLSGYKINLEKLGNYCNEHNIILSVDAIQGLGVLNLDVQKFNIDFVSNGTQKWMLGLQGMAFIYISKKLQEQVNPAFVGWLSVENAWELLNYDLKLKETASVFQTGTLNTIGIYTLNTSMKLFKEYGFQKIENTVLDHTFYLRNKLSVENQTLFPKNLLEENYSGIVSIRHKDPEGLFNWLSERKIVVSLRENIIRLSPHFYNTTEEIDIVVDAIVNF